MKQPITLKILDYLSWLYRLLGVDYRTLKLIVSFKLTMDKRRVPTIMANNQQKKEPLISPYAKSLLLYALIGLLLIPILILGTSYYLQLGIVFGMVTFILMTSMISDFSSVLLDVRDKVVLDTKPVDLRTVAFAKLTHVVIYMTQLVGAFLLVPFVVSSIVRGVLFSLILLVSIILLSILCIVITALFYMLILKFFDGERLRDLINYIQIFLSVGVVFIYQLIGQSFSLIDPSISIDIAWWHVLLPPLWFGALFEVVLLGQSQFILLISASMALIVPIVSLWIYVKLLPTFEQNLAKLLHASTRKKAKKRRLTQAITKWLSFDQQEAAIFSFAQAMMSQEREFKLKVYPTLGISIAFPLFMIAILLIDGAVVNPMADYLSSYFALISIPTTVAMLKYSSKYKGAYLYRMLPAREQSLYYRATLKAFMIQLFLPIILLLLVIHLFLIGPVSLIHFLIIFLIGCILTPISYRVLNNGRYPFTESFSMIDASNSMLIVGMMFIIAIFAVAHYFISLFPYALYLYIPILYIINLIVWKKTFK